MCRKTGPEDVVFKVLYCGVDHSDLHQIRNEAQYTTYPLVPGHEVVGKVIEVGSDVKKFVVRDIVGVVCMVGSCGECMRCKTNKEQYCKNMVFTYNTIYKDGSFTQGGFSSAMIVHQNYVVNIPEKTSPRAGCTVTMCRSDGLQSVKTVHRDAGPSVEERAILYLEAQDRVTKGASLKWL
ncbi:putative cinnamyl-alcohol dehydrogenase [Helianthus annuus]|uniref:Cinnamyl-alcohol dehydrogenase n=1 Tax=Helianthus annuus TaxID=4232 RepID=A0A9K3H522_HELAN|nr:putative cinnamyl-alcohol dehydrogenase [Helianthus annuus]KAJ0833026.1 putative cinnamyl-alcohol dehydrogenase [Helianthus annuus]